MEDLRIYVASLSDYNNGRLEGKWLDLSDYSDASELMEAIQEMLDELTEKYKSVDGEVREEWAIHDYEGIPSTMASEYMGEQDFQQIYDIAEVADESGVPFEVLIERAGDTGSDDYKALAESLMFIVQGNDESDIVHEYEDQIGELGSDFWSNHIYIDDVTERVIYGEDVDRFREDILYENPDMDEDEAERQAEEMADEEAERREDLTTYLEDMGYGDEIPSFVTKDYDEAWKRSMSYDFDVIYHDEQMYVFSNNYSLGGNILSGMIGAYIGYKVGRARPQKKGFSTEKKIGRKIKGAFSKKKMERGGKFNQSWSQDHSRHNKSENYEVPVAKRKSKFAGGGGVDGKKYYMLFNISEFGGQPMYNFTANSKQEVIDILLESYENITKHKMYSNEVYSMNDMDESKYNSYINDDYAYVTANAKEYDRFVGGYKSVAYQKSGKYAQGGGISGLDDLIRG